MLEENADDVLKRADAFAQEVLTWWEEEGIVPNEERRRRWEGLLEQYPDLPLDQKHRISAKVGKHVSHRKRHSER